MKYVVYFPHTIKILISNWPRTQKFSQLLKARKTDSLDFAHHDHSLVTVFVQFYAVIAQNLTGEFIRKIYAASWILFTLTGVWKSRKPESGIGTGMGTETCGPFLERPGNFSGPKANFKFKTCWIAAQFLAHKPVNFASFTDSFIVSLSKVLKLWSSM